MCSNVLYGDGDGDGDGDGGLMALLLCNDDSVGDVEVVDLMEMVR